MRVLPHRLEGRVAQPAVRHVEAPQLRADPLHESDDAGVPEPRAVREVELHELRAVGGGDSEPEAAIGHARAAKAELRVATAKVPECVVGERFGRGGLGNNFLPHGRGQRGDLVGWHLVEGCGDRAGGEG